MDIRKLNEKLDGILNEERKLIPDLIAKYGDLTIPEFIDELIQAEQKGEDILDESLNESANIDSYISKFLKQLQREITKISMDVYISGSRSLIKNYYHYECSEPKTFGGSSDWYAPAKGTVIMSVSAKPIDINVLTIYCKQASKENIEDEFGFTVSAVPHLSEYGYKDKDVDNWFRSAFDSCLRKACEKHSIEPGKKSVPYGPAPCRPTHYIECDSPQSFKQSSNEYISLIKDMFLLINERALTQDNNAKDASQKAANEFEELAKARREARANKNAKSTTVKQALSKSSVAKKIQALQNPTPEQLAKILAAIEG